MQSTSEYRFARADEIEEVARMIAHSFPGPTRTPAWWYEQLADPRFGGGHSTLFIGRQAGRTFAALQLHPLRQWIGGALHATAGIGTVAIAPTHRKRGLGSTLMTEALQAAHARGDAASALYPFRTSFYQRLGYGEAGQAMQYLVGPAELPDDDGRVEVELLDAESGRAECLELYSRWARTQTGQVERSHRLWASICTAPDRALAGFRNPDGLLEGYALVAYRTDLPREERYLEVDELVWTTDAARRGLYGWLHSLGDQWERVLLRALPSHRLGDWIREPRLPHGSAPHWGLWAPGATLMVGPMFRIVDMEACWSNRRTTADAQCSATLVITDAQLPQNDGEWILSCDGGRAAIKRAGAANPAHSDAVTLRTDISTLSRIYAGAMSIADAIAAGRLSCDRPDRMRALDAALALPEPWTFDRF